MRPIVILYPSKDNKIVLTKEDFEGYLKQAYDAGYSDGQASRSWNWWNTPISYPNTNPIQWTSTTPNLEPDYTKVTCDAHNDL